MKELITLINNARKKIGDFNVIGENARFYDDIERRPDVQKWKNLDLDSLLQQQKVHRFHDDGSRLVY